MSESKRARTCLNCGKDISHRDIQAQTCDATCRQAYNRKRRAAADVAAVIDETPSGNAKARSVAKRAVEHEVRELVKPVVREALTEDVLGALQDLVRLTPAAVATLASHIDGDDPVLAQKAATTVMRYTVGHQALVTPQEASAPQLVVNFDLPRPNDPSPGTWDTPEGNAVELFECDVCHSELPATERVAGADRCATCHEARKRAVLEQYGLIDSA